MKFDQSDSVLHAAFAIVKEYDVRTYNRMAKDEWYVTTSVEDYVRNGFLPGEPQEMTIRMFQSGVAAFGITMSAGSVAPEIGPLLQTDSGVTLINVAGSNAAAVHYKMDATKFIADVLVHEYRHVHQSYPTGTKADMVAHEVPAFDAGCTFALRLPPPDSALIFKLSSETKQEVISE
jgi:hypothetical protein